MNEIIKKFLESISLSKENWIVILFCLLITFTISGSIYIKALYARIESLEENIIHWKDMSKSYQENTKTIIEQYKEELNQVERRMKFECEMENNKAYREKSEAKSSEN